MECCFNKHEDELKKYFRILELYSGIGGIHYALQYAAIPHVVVGACDINTVANQIYKYNFPRSRHFQKNIVSLSTAEIDEMKPELWTMSPPCQPFTRVGLKNDCEDSRSMSFLHVLNILKAANYKPEYIFLENVKGFETSKTRKLLLETLIECSYTYQEFLLSPIQFGVPNSRLRYYLLAKKQPSEFCFQVSDEIIEYIPSGICPTYGSEPDKLFNYLQNDFDEDFYLIPDKLLLKYVMAMDIVDQHSTRSCCFTKAYSQYAQGTGSVLLSNGVNMSSIFEKISAQLPDDVERLKLLKTLKLRYFTPREVANLMCFPGSFKLPPSISRKQQYQVLGNSVNIRVVGELLRILLM